MAGCNRIGFDFFGEDTSRMRSSPFAFDGISVPLGYRRVEELMAERGLSIDHTRVWRSVQRYAPLPGLLHAGQR